MALGTEPPLALSRRIRKQLISRAKERPVSAAELLRLIGDALVIEKVPRPRHILRVIFKPYRGLVVHILRKRHKSKASLR